MAQASIPQSIRTHILDNLNYAMSPVFIPQIHLLMEFEGSLDVDRLKKALRLCLDVEPVLGCRYALRWIAPRWKRIPAEKLDRLDFLETAQGNDNHLDRFISADLCATSGPQFRALLLTGDGGDRLILKVNHQVADAGGTKDLGYLIASLYRRLGSNPNLRPQPNRGSRGLRQVYLRFLPRHLFALLRRYFLESKGNLFPLESLHYPCQGDRDGPWRYVYFRLNAAQTTQLREYGNQHQATINDMIATAVLRAFVRETGWQKGQGELRLVNTVDLRRYMPEERAEAICNLSSFCFINLHQNLGSDFSETLTEVKAQFDGLKRNYIGLGFFFGGYINLLPYPFALKKRLLAYLFRKGVEKKNLPPSFTNLGPLDSKALDFGVPSLRAAEMIAPPACPPSIVIGLSGFRDSLTLSVGFFESAVSALTMKDLLDDVCSDLPIQNA